MFLDFYKHFNNRIYQLRQHTPSILQWRWRNHLCTKLHRYDKHGSFQHLSSKECTVFIECKLCAPATLKKHMHICIPLLFNRSHANSQQICLYCFTGYLSRCSHHTECICRYLESAKVLTHSNWVSLSYISRNQVQLTKINPPTDSSSTDASISLDSDLSDREPRYWQDHQHGFS
jgi:hypothetical protein